MPQSTAPRASRSVSGCLTCRRRKVKCTSRSSPCEPCSRLRLSCIASFQENIRVWSASGGLRPKNTTRTRDTRRSIHTVSSQVLFPEDSQVDQAASPGLAEDCSPRNAIYDLSERIKSSTSTNRPGDSVQTTVATGSINTSICEDVPEGNNDLTLSVSRQSAYDPSPIDSWIAFGSSLPPYSPIFNSLHVDDSLSGILSTLPGQNWDIATWTQYMNRVPEWLSTKRSMWSCYHYLINLAQAIPDSPLFHGILSWTYAYLFRLGLVSPDPSRLKHYMTASDSIHLLSREASDGPVYLNLLVINPSDRLSQYISTTFFLCQHDLIVGDFDSFKTRINDVKQTFIDRWRRQILPGAIESRIIIWLAFMELRYLLMAGDDTNTGQNPKDLMAVLVELEAIPALRGARRQQSYLIECFGNGLPSEENDEDLRKERCREKFDAIFAYLSKVRSFRAWDQSAKLRMAAEPLVEELREAKIDALRADLGRIHACKLVVASQELPSTVYENFDSGIFAIMTVKALSLSATIMLNQTIGRNLRTDEQTQSAAHELIQIARIFRKSQRLVSPCSTIWPLPIFFAGIGVTDEIYQDWALGYMKELEHWGAHVVRAKDTMEHLIDMQAKDGDRVNVRNFL
ncbi:fungal transcriptional regulatory protein [Penicillium waksmanii]|uniref:fungal transcriptional regulatory protein n=1 Tax=Penicillium waksmanii TaxID=69791 RepID=UPI002548697F|nr:fungal transcriptional regulatory protein [Penicillium waksmanii]KAJ5981015.1 fungal transcriptional regulatory protein [Penicillium waksmanii]